MKRRNRESRARVRIIQEQHMDKDAQRRLDQTKCLTGASYVRILQMFRTVDRVKASILSFKTQIAKALVPSIRNLTSAVRRVMEDYRCAPIIGCAADMKEDTYNRGDLNGYTAEEMKEAGEAAGKGFLAGLSLAKRLNKPEE